MSDDKKPADQPPQNEEKKPSTRTAKKAGGDDDLEAKLEALMEENKKLKGENKAIKSTNAQLAESLKSAEQTMAKASVFSENEKRGNPRYQKSYKVRSLSGKAEPQIMEFCCDEPEAFRQYARLTGLDPTKELFAAELVEDRSNSVEQPAE